jgi:hypothetical protein
MKVLLHLNPDPIVEVVEGIRYELPPGEAFEVEDDFHADKILERISWGGIVEVPVRKVKGGTEYDLDFAVNRAEELLKAAEDKTIAEYVTAQKDERIAKGRPALPPEGRAAEIILRRRIDLGKEYNLFPIGWSLEGKTLKTAGGQVVEENKQLAADNEALLAENETLRQQLEDAKKAKKPAKPKAPATT